ncbi:hypothetical protein ASE66_13610 [Bosea sp. Root483D1]|nr:hypothetical protein ASE66_13610 [Bosea sp. Root483D1]
MQASQAILKSVQPHLLIVCEDGPGGNAALIATARQKGLPTLVTPFGIGEQKDYDNFIEDRAREGSLTLVPEGPIGEAVRSFAPHWIRPSPHGEVLIHPAEFILAKVAVGLDLPKPWVVQGGTADLIAVESPAMRRHYLREGIAESKLRQIGSVYCDVIADVLARDPKAMHAYRSASVIDEGRLKLLIALPPSYHGARGHLAEHASYSDFVRSLVTEAARIPGIDLSVAVHPGTHAADRQAISAAGARISTNWLLEEIPRCDVFLTTWSSTIRWAIACKKPVLNYDAYGFALPTYRDAGGVTTTRNLAELIARLRNLAENPDALRAHAARQAESAPDWGQFDGGDFKRLLLLARELVASRRFSPRRAVAKLKTIVKKL